VHQRKREREGEKNPFKSNEIIYIISPNEKKAHHTKNCEGEEEKRAKKNNFK
jgi:hypothetical protein